MSRRSSIPRGVRAGWLVALALCGQAVADKPPTLTVTGADRALGETPVVVEAPASMQPGDYEAKALRANVVRDGGKLYLAAILESVPADETASYTLSEVASPRPPATGIELIPRGRRVEVRDDGKLVTEYVPDDGPKPYFYPVFGHSGAMMTRSFPMKQVDGEKNDHPHHRSLWFTHGSVNKVDFWSEFPGHGRIVETSRPTVSGGLAMGVLRTTDDWLAADGRKVCEDERVVRFYSTSKARLIDFDVTLKATEGPLTFGDTKEGMFGLRVATSMDVTSNRGGKIVTAGGLQDKAAWGKPDAWVDYSGPVDGKVVGVAILNHPSSFRYPTTWHVRDYGLFAANPFGYRDFGQSSSGEHVLPRGESIRFRYRLVLHDGDAASAALPYAFWGYADPPAAVVD